MNSIQKVLMAGTAATVLFASTFSSSAAGLKDIFDAKYYADNNADLKAAYGYDEEKLYKHFVEHGLKENRKLSPILNVAEYRKAYKDLDAAFGDNWDAYVQHFLETGAYEKRSEGVLFNPVIYAEAYADVAQAFGKDVMAIAQHYLTVGISENRTAGSAEGYESLAAKEKAEEASGAAGVASGAGEDDVVENPTVSGGDEG